MLTVAIATESESFDAEAYRALLSRLLDEEVTRWKTDLRFSGWKSVCRDIPLYLDKAADAGVTRALVAIDNDGGARRRPEHDVAHVSAQQASDDEDGCAFCLLTESVPSSWVVGDRKQCLVVPVQVLETWLLVIRGETLSPSPEQAHAYSRSALKKRFFGDSIRSQATRTVMALEQIQKPEALERLRALPSFRLFADQVDRWAI
ncbi:MAG: hypothetical protein ACMG6S_03295 [Byssovorax sp.]